MNDLQRTYITAKTAEATYEAAYGFEGLPTLHARRARLQAEDKLLAWGKEWCEQQGRPQLVPMFNSPLLKIRAGLVDLLLKIKED